MITKDKIKREIDKIPEEQLEKLYRYITNLQRTKNKKHKLRTYKLQGQFDDIDVREKAYE